MEQTSNALALCSHPGNEAYDVIEVERITSIVAMVPMPAYTGYANCSFVMERFGLDIEQLSGGPGEDMTE